MTDAERARLRAFLDATDPNERDWVAFWEFEAAIGNAASCAGLINLYDSGPEGTREQDALRLVLSEMLFRVLPRVDLGTLIDEVEGIGYALRYGLIEPKRDALDGIESTEAYLALSARGHAADQADTDRRVRERAERSKEEAEEE